MRRSLQFAGHSGGLLVALFAVASCAALFTTDIDEIKKDPGSFHGKQVTIAGEVTTRINVLGLGYYEVADDTGSIGVVTKGTVPKKGEKVRVKGEVDQAFAVAGRSLVVIVEPGTRE
jgi:hypothetical protein